MEHRSTPSGAAATRPPTDPPDLQGHAALEQSLAEAVPGFELVDQALELGRGQHAHLLGVDAEGRLVVVLLVAGDADTALLRAADALAFGNRHGEALVRHLGHARLSAGAGLRVALVAEEFDELALERLRALQPVGVEAFALRILKSREHESSYLEQMVGPTRPGARAPRPGASVEALLGGLGEPERSVALEVRARLERLDERLALSVEAESLVWRREGEELAVLEFPAEGAPRGSVPGSGQRALGSERDLELFVDEVVAEYLRRADPGWGAAEFGPG